MASSALIKAVAVTAELCGRTFSEAAAVVFVEDLSAYPEHQVLGALRRCRREVRGVLTVQDVVSRLDDGRPGAEEAWAMLPKSEADSVVWTDEMAQAMRVAQPLLDEGDRVAARLAFKESYTAAVMAARDVGRAPAWQASLGHDARGREAVVVEALQLGRLSAERARELLPAPEQVAPNVAALLGAAFKPLLTHEPEDLQP